jgi:probable HAF family extracellular repeat protein
MALHGFRFLFVGSVLLFAPRAFAQQYAVTDLGRLPGARSSLPAAINGNGQVAGISDSDGDEVWHPFLWTHGTMQDLGLLPGFTRCASTAINDRGDVVGWCYNFQSTQAFVWTADAGLTPVAPLGSQAYGINNHGDIVGFYRSGEDGRYYAFVYRDGVLQNLGVGTAYGISDDGKIVGRSDETGHATLWDQDGPHDLGALNGTNGSSAALAMNAAGLIVGDSMTGGPQNETHAVLWNGYGIADLGTLGQGLDSDAVAISGDLIVGSSQTDRVSVGHAFLYDNNGPGYPVDLNDLIPTSSGALLQFGYGVNAAGQIVAGGRMTGQGGFHAFLLTPVQPSPTSLAGLPVGWSGLEAGQPADGPSCPCLPADPAYDAGDLRGHLGKAG